MGDDGDTLDELRRAVVSLAVARFDKSYVPGSGTHVVKQAKGTEFDADGIAGQGDFADEAYAAYLENLAAYASCQDERRLKSHERKLKGMSPSAQQR